MEEENYSDFKYYLEDLNYQIEKSYRSRNRMKSILRLYVLLGLFVFLSASVYFVFRYFKIELDPGQKIIVLVGVSGLALSAVAKFIIDYLTEKEKENVQRKTELDKLSSFIFNWATLEKAIGRFLESRNKEANPFAIGQNIEMLFKEGVITNREYLTLEKALDIRNAVVHGKFALPSDIEKYNTSINRIIDKIVENSR